MASPPPAGDTTIFRPSKKRKIYRQRATTDDEPPVSPGSAPAEQSIEELIASSTAHGNAADEMEGTAVSMAEILRLRNLKKKRGGGVEFRAAGTTREPSDQDALVLHNGEGNGEEVNDVDTVVGRFAPQTGIGGGGGMDVDRHM
jgi:hypothetical protein